MKISQIDKDKRYSLNEIVREGLIPGITGYAAAYNLVTYSKEDEGRVLHKKTAPAQLKAQHDGRPWNKIKGKITVKGSEIIKFRELNGLE